MKLDGWAPSALLLTVLTVPLRSQIILLAGRNLIERLSSVHNDSVPVWIAWLSHWAVSQSGNWLRDEPMRIVSCWVVSGGANKLPHPVLNGWGTLLAPVPCASLAVWQQWFSWLPDLATEHKQWNYSGLCQNWDALCKAPATLNCLQHWQRDGVQPSTLKLGMGNWTQTEQIRDWDTDTLYNSDCQTAGTRLNYWSDDWPVNEREQRNSRK